MVCHHEDGHLELVVADIRVGVSHVERPSSHDDRSGRLDGGVHVGRASEGVQVWIEATDATGRIGHEAV
jgi:hypothetical protein